MTLHDGQTVRGGEDDHRLQVSLARTMTLCELFTWQRRRTLAATEPRKVIVPERRGARPQNERRLQALIGDRRPQRPRPGQRFVRAARPLDPAHGASFGEPTVNLGPTVTRSARTGHL
ncbi:MAG: hypothetical protein ACYCT1_01385 [Steroidobacteraceae bacterium]